MILTKEQQSFLYDFLYEEADKIFKDNQICKDCPYNYKCCYPCNVECKYHNESGCTTSCLGCKVYLCDEKRNELKDTDILTKIDYLLNLTNKYGLLMYCFSKEELLGEVKW